jgi:hypothetical protein
MYQVEVSRATGGACRIALAEKQGGASRASPAGGLMIALGTCQTR